MSRCSPAETGFLLAQVGGHAAMRFAERLAPIGLGPPHAGVLRALSHAPGVAQQVLATTLGVAPSRLVALVDELEGRGLVERRDQPDDRRSYALHLTAAGRDVLAQIGRTAREHDTDLCAPLDREEREVLAALLGRIADAQGLTRGVHPGFGKLAGKRKG